MEIIQAHLNEVADNILARNVISDVWRIKIDGEFVTMASGKSSWKAAGHAKNALRYEMDRAMRKCISEIRDIHDSYSSMEARAVFEEQYEIFIANRVEFVKI